MRIVHITDFHLDKNFINDFDVHVINPLIKDLTAYNNQKKIDLIICSGDLINEGGRSFDSIDLAFTEFETKIATPILNALNLNRDRFFFSPGNHDIDRNADSKMIEAGLKQQLITTNDVNEFIDRNETEGIKRILPYKHFETSFYEEINIDKYQTSFSSNYIIKIGELKIGLSSFNSAWRCYKSEEDRLSILVGERQVTNAINYIENCDIKIGIIHHALDWLAEFDKDSVEPFIKRVYNYLFMGHVHKGSAYTNTNMYGSSFVSVGSGAMCFNAQSDSKNYSNGYNIIDVGELNSITTHFRRYSTAKNGFTSNSDLGDDHGIMNYVFPTAQEVAKISYLKDAVSVVKKVHADTLNADLLSFGTDTQAPKDIESIFVHPLLEVKSQYDIEKEAESTNIRIEDLSASDENYIIFGTKESGKTVLLDKILLDLSSGVDTYKKIPVLIDFKDISTRVETLIKNFLSKGSSEVKSLLAENKITLLIDNISFKKEDKSRLSILERFISANKSNLQVICTSLQLIENEVPIEMAGNLFFQQFKVVHVRSFKTRQIRELIHKWFGQSGAYDVPEKLDKLINTFQALNLPRNPLSVSMFLWIIEKQENYRPINNSTMLENFIERLFKKLDKKEIYSERFDFKNNDRLLGEIAYKMYKSDNDNYHITYVDLIKFIQEHLDKNKFEFEPDKILENFLTKGIFLRDGNTIRFRFTCFFHYFLMKKMDFDPVFRAEALSDEKFLMFAEEIDYYTGIKRDQTDILDFIVKQMEVKYAPLLKDLEQHGIDKFFKTKESMISALDNNQVAKSLSETAKPKEEDLDLIKDKSLDSMQPDKGIAKKEQINDIEQLERLWLLAAQVLKNTEEVGNASPDIKNVSYEKIIRCSLAFATLYKIKLQIYLKQNLDKISPELRENLKMINGVLPVIHQLVTFHYMGTAKLGRVISEKIDKDKKDKSISDFERFLSVFLFAELKTKGYRDVLKHFTGSIRENYIRDMTFMKLVTYYFLRSKTEEDDVFYLNLIADLIIQAKGGKKIEKTAIMDEYRKKREKRSRENTSQLSLELDGE